MSNIINIYSEMYSQGVIPVVKIDDISQSIPMAHALFNGDMNVIEITLRSDCAIDAIREIAKIPNMLVLAGTVLTLSDAKKALDAGACAIVSPGTNMEIVRYCVKNGILVIPGCATPTEIEACINEGLELVKLFPCEVLGGISMLKALAGPYSGMKFMATGGINQDNIANYMSLSNVFACGASYIVTRELLESNNYAKITELAKSAKLVRIL